MQVPPPNSNHSSSSPSNQIGPTQPSHPSKPTKPDHGASKPSKDFHETLKRVEKKVPQKPKPEHDKKNTGKKPLPSPFEPIKPPPKPIPKPSAKLKEEEEAAKEAEAEEAKESAKSRKTPAQSSILSALEAERQQLAKLAKALEQAGTLEGKEKGKLVSEEKDKGKGAKGLGMTPHEAAAVQGIPGQQPVQLGVEVTAGAAATKPTTSIEQIIEVFEKNRLFDSGVSQVQVVPRGNETQISVTLSTGIKVDVNVAPGGHDLNIHITGLNATVQAAIDNPQNQEKLRQLLIEKGFAVHQIVTERAEQAPISTSTREQSSQQDQGGRGGGRGGEQPGGQGGQQQKRG